jgi:hypothetical protein
MMNVAQSVLPRARITGPALSREERGCGLGRLAQVQISEPGLLPGSAIRITVSALASGQLPDDAVDDAWHRYLEAVRLCEDSANGRAMGLGFDLGTYEAERDEALSVLLDGSAAA